MISGVESLILESEGTETGQDGQTEKSWRIGAADRAEIDEIGMQTQEVE